jgi:hypothetical protein
MFALCPAASGVHWMKYTANLVSACDKSPQMVLDVRPQQAQVPCDSPQGVAMIESASLMVHRVGSPLERGVGYR